MMTILTEPPLSTLPEYTLSPVPPLSPYLLFLTIISLYLSYRILLLLYYCSPSVMR